MTADIPARGITKERGRAIGVADALPARMGVIGDGGQTPPRRGAGIVEVRRALFRADHTVQRVIAIGHLAGVGIGELNEIVRHVIGVRHREPILMGLRSDAPECVVK